MRLRRSRLTLATFVAALILPFALIYALRYLGVFSRRYQTAHDRELYAVKTGSEIQEEFALLRRQRSQCKRRLAALKQEREALRPMTTHEARDRLEAVESTIESVEDAIEDINRELFRVEGPSVVLVVLTVAAVTLAVCCFAYYVAKKAGWD